MPVNSIFGKFAENRLNLVAKLEDISSNKSIIQTIADVEILQKWDNEST